MCLSVLTEKPDWLEKRDILCAARSLSRQKRDDRDALAVGWRNAIVGLALFYVDHWLVSLSVLRQTKCHGACSWVIPLVTPTWIYGWSYTNDVDVNSNAPALKFYDWKWISNVLSADAGWMASCELHWNAIVEIMYALRGNWNWLLPWAPLTLSVCIPLNKGAEHVA